MSEGQSARLTGSARRGCRLLVGEELSRAVLFPRCDPRHVFRRGRDVFPPLTVGPIDFAPHTSRRFSRA